MRTVVSLSRTTRRWLLLFVLAWAVSCAVVWMAAPAYLILIFVVMQFVLFPVLMFGVCASAGWKADPGPVRWLLPAVLALVYSIWPLNMLAASPPSPPELSFILFGAAIAYLGLAAGTIVRRVLSSSRKQSS